MRGQGSAPVDLFTILENVFPLFLLENVFPFNTLNRKLSSQLFSLSNKNMMAS